MTKAHLSTCPGCARHVRTSETTCPFCGNALSEDFRAQARPRPPIARLSRAAMYALGASAIAAGAASAIGCSTSVPIYGAPAVPAADASDDDRNVPIYGAPAVDANTDAPIQVDAAYGGPPMDGGDGGDGG